MHCLFLGIAKWIVKRLWIDHKKLTTSQLKQIQKKMSEIQVPSDIGQIPRKVDCVRDLTILQLMNRKHLS
jgi:hypothetical protein